MSQYFPKPYETFGGDINIKVDLSNYATKTDLKNVSHVDVSHFALKSNLANLKTEVDKLDVEKLAPASVDLSKLSDVVKNDVVKKTEYEKLVGKVNDIDTTGFVLKTTYDTDKSDLGNKISDADKKIPDPRNLAKKTDLNAKFTEIESKIASITHLVTNSALTAVENKMPDVSSLLKKTDYYTKVSEIGNKITDHNHDKHITTPEFNSLATGIFTAILAQADLVTTKTDFDNKLQSVTSNKKKHLLVENELKKLKTVVLSYFKSKDHFGEDGTQNYLVFQPMHRYFKRIAGVGIGNYIYF